MAGFLTGAGSMFGGGGNQGQYAQQAWQTGQFMPYNLSTPGSNISYANNQVTGALNPANQGFYNAALGTATNNLTGGSSTYNPNTSFLPGQYNSIYGGNNFLDKVNTQYSNLVNGQMPFLQKTMQDTLDNEQSRGTLASTAGTYQTAGQQMALGGILGQDYSQAFNQATTQANSQFAAAQGVGNLQEQQAEFGPQFSQNQTQGLFSDTLNTNALTGQQALQGGQLGALRSAANTNAISPLIQSGINQDQNTASLLNGLLFGGGANGNGGFLGSLLGGGGNGTGQQGGGGLLGQLGSKAGNYLLHQGENYLGGLFSGGGSALGASGAADAAGMASGWAGDAAAMDGAYAGIGADTGLATSTTAADISAANDAWLSSLGGDFSTAGGGAAVDAGATAAADTGGVVAGSAETADMAAPAFDAYTAEAGADAGASGASGAGLGAGAGAALAFAPFAAILGKMLMNPDDVMLKAPYWQGLTQQLQGNGSNINSGPGGGGAAAKQYGISDAVQEALSTPQSQVPAAIQQLVWNTGLVPYGTWGIANPVNATGVGGKAGPTTARRNFSE